jgi:hypothetical protein
VQNDNNDIDLPQQLRLTTEAETRMLLPLMEKEKHAPTMEKNRSSSKNHIQIENSMPGSSDWVLTNPALQREVEGYMSRTSIQRGQNISLFYSSQEAEQVKVEVFRSGWYSGVGGRKVLSATAPGINQDMPLSGKDGLIVCQWRDPFVLRTEKNWTTGVYLVKMTESKLNTQSYAIFVLRADDLGYGEIDITFQLPFNTYQAYNIWGGENLYRCTDSDGCHQARKVSFDRPYAGPENKLGAFGTGAGEYLSNVQPLDYQTIWNTREGGISSAASWNYNMVRWLERNNLCVTYVTNTDVHIRLPSLAKPKLFLTQGHDEYWSWEMRDHVTAWRDEGIHLAFLGSNTAYWQIRYENVDNAHGDEEPRTIVCYRRLRIETNKTKYASIKFRVNRPEALMIGLEYAFPGGDPFDEDLIVYDSSHWIFNGTGVSKGDKIPGLLGCKNTCLLVLLLFALCSRYLTECPFFTLLLLDEVDRINSRSLVPKGENTEEAIPVESVVKLFETPLITRRNERIHAHGAIYQKENTHVFGAGTMQWSWGLDDYGVEQGLRSSRLSHVVETMTWNLFRASGILLKADMPRQQKSKKNPGEGWIYEPKNLDFFWKKMGDRPFLREFYSHLRKYKRIIDIGARGYNRNCKKLINSTTTTYFQVEPFPPSLDEMNNDGLLECYMQEVPDKYPMLRHSFDLVLDFGVFGWESVQETFGVSEIQKYVESVSFLLHEHGVWVLKIDKGFVPNQDEFFRKYLLPYFSLGDFEVYKSGHTIKGGKWSFYFLHKEVAQSSVKL